MVSSVFVHPGIDKVSVLAQCSLAGSCVHKAMSVQLQGLGSIVQVMLLPIPFHTAEGSLSLT